MPPLPKTLWADQGPGAGDAIPHLCSPHQMLVDKGETSFQEQVRRTQELSAYVDTCGSLPGDPTQHRAPHLVRTSPNTRGAKPAGITPQGFKPEKAGGQRTSFPSQS